MDSPYLYLHYNADTHIKLIIPREEVRDSRFFSQYIKTRVITYEVTGSITVHVSPNYL